MAAYIFGVIAGVPINVVPQQDNGIGWQVTPWLNLTGIGDSSDLAQGGFLAGGGLSSDLDYRINNWRFGLADQISYDWGAPIGYGKLIDFRQNISQFILKNGVRAEYDFTQSWYADASLTYTNMLNGAFTDDYYTPAAGMGYRFSPDCALHAGYFGDYAHDYNATGVEIHFNFSF